MRDRHLAGLHQGQRPAVPRIQAGHMTATRDDHDVKKTLLNRNRPHLAIPCRPFEQLVAPLLDLVRVNVDILRQLDQPLLALDRNHSHFCLKCRAVFPARSLWHSHLLACSIMPLLRGKSTYPGCPDFRNHLL